MQELKSASAALPASVAEEIVRAGWASDLTPATSQQQQQQQQRQQQRQQQQRVKDQQSEGASQQEASTPVPGEGSITSDKLPGSQYTSAPIKQPLPQHSHFQVPGITITSFHLHQLQASIKLLPDVGHSWLVHEMTGAVLEEATASGISQLCPGADILAPEAVAAAVLRGFSVRAWGIKNEQLLLHAVKCGAQGATVDWPHIARDALKIVLHPPE
ncbi:MAG: hypothetical protein WDW36_007747 [Sanguina aurantia]